MATVIFSEGEYTGDWLKGEIEIPQHFSRDQVTLNNGTGTAVTLTTGTVLGKITASGLFVQLAPGATDGSQNVAGILGPTSVIPATGTTTAWAITRSATVSDTNIIYPAGITAPQTATAIQQLGALGVIVRRTA